MSDDCTGLMDNFSLGHRIGKHGSHKRIGHLDIILNWFYGIWGSPRGFMTKEGIFVLVDK